MSVEGQVTLKAAIQETGTLGLDASVSYAPDFLHVFNFSDGSGALELAKVGSKEVSIGASPTDLALTSSADFKDFEGSAITFTSLKVLGLYAPDTNSGSVVIGAASSNAMDSILNATGTITLRPGEGMLFVSKHATGAPVDAGDLLRVSGTSGDKIQVLVAGNAS